MTFFFRKFGWLRRLAAKENDLDEELRFHIEEETSERLREGMTSGPARQGGVDDTA